MAQYVKASFYIRKGSAIFEREGYTFVRNGRVFCVHNENKGDKNNPAWIVTDPNTGMSVITCWEDSRKKAVEVFDEKFLAKFIEITKQARYAQAVDEFDAMFAALNHEDAPAEEVTEEAVGEAIEDAPADEAPAEPQPAGVTEHNIWFAEKVDGASEYKGKRKKHQGMWWLPNTPANRERFGIAAA